MPGQSSFKQSKASDKYLISKVLCKGESIHSMRAIEECIEARNATEDKSVTERIPRPPKSNESDSKIPRI
jgi:hypothetical protein